MRIGPLFIGWRPLCAAEAFCLDLDVSRRWESFDVEFFGYGMTVLVRVAS